MAETKYRQYVIEKPMRHGLWDSYDFYGDEDYKSGMTFMFLKVAEPCEMEDKPHSHDFDMYLHFLSFDPDDMEHLDADIEIGLGPEREIHQITSPCSVFIPKGMIHCPLTFKRVGKPILFVHTSVSPKYYKLEEQGC